MQAPASEGCHTGAKSAGLRGVHRGGHGALSLTLAKKGGVKAGDTSFREKESHTGAPALEENGAHRSHVDTSSVSPQAEYVLKTPHIA